MTREDAIERFNGIINAMSISVAQAKFYPTKAELDELCDMAIEALTYKNLKKPNNTCEVDLISRADAIGAVWRAITSDELVQGSVEEEILKLPSAEAETKCVAQIKVDTEEIVRRIKEEYDITDGWVPCSERLPEVGEICLLTVHEYGWNCKDYTRVIIGEYSDNYADHILAWMPLPKPYKGAVK